MRPQITLARVRYRSRRTPVILLVWPKGVSRARGGRANPRGPLHPHGTVTRDRPEADPSPAARDRSRLSIERSHHHSNSHTYAKWSTYSTGVGNVRDYVERTPTRGADMTDDGLDEERQEHEAEPALDWSPLGTTAPRVPHRRPRKHRDLGPGGSHRQDADRARSLRHPVRFHGVPVARTLAIASGAILVAALVLTIAISGWWVLALLAVTVPPMVAGVRLLVVRPTAEARLIVRARAEQRIAAELDPLAVSGWTLFHDRVLVGGEHRLAHIAVGPAGVFVIEPRRIPHHRRAHRGRRRPRALRRVDAPWPVARYPAVGSDPA